MPHNNITHPEMVTKSAEFLTILTPQLYAHIVSLFPTPEKYAELHQRLENSITGYLKGDPEQVKECEEARRELNLAMTVINGVGKAVSPVDPTILDTLKVSKHATASATQALVAAKDLKVYFDKNGQPYCSLSKLAGAKGYEIWFCEGEPSVESNWQFLDWSPNCQGISLKGLNRTKTNYLKLRAKRGNSTFGPWSNMVILQPV